MDLRRFCTEIGLPSGAVCIVEKMNEEISEVRYQYVRKLFFTNREEIFREIASLAGYRQRFLYYYCRLACETYEKYQRAGIGDRVFFDTFSDIAVWCQVCFRRYGEYGIQEYEWLWRHVEMTLFRLGRLQFEKTESLWEFEYNGRKTAVGDPVISIHIPEGQPLDPEACRESLDMGRKFWGGELPFLCHSWLLFPGLKELLDEKSNILRFQKMFEIQSVDFQFREGEERIFDCLMEDPEKYPENTSLQRNARKYLKQGGRLGSGLGVTGADQAKFHVLS